MPALSLPELLLRASVRVDVGGLPNGSGFFIAPTHVVTCAHVLDEYMATSAAARPQLHLVDSRGVKHEITGEPRVSTRLDLAILHLSSADTEVAVAYLDERFDVGDQLLAFGFPGGKPDGEPATFETEWQTGEATPHIKFKQGQVRPGMSGSPLLNRTTGAVCGIVRRTRNEKLDLGGYGIRVAGLFEAFDDVRKLNAEALKADQRWPMSLTDEQRRRLTGSPLPVEDVAYVEFVIEVDQQAGQWLVRGGSLPGTQQTLVVVDLNAVRAEVPRLFRAWKAQGRINDSDQSRLLGHILFRSIAPGAIGAALEGLAFDEKRAVHVSLRFATGMDADLVHLPWEQMFVRGRSISAWLGTTPRATLTRVREPQPDPDPPHVPGEADVLLVTAAHDGHRDVASVAKSLAAEIRKLEGIRLGPGDVQLTLDDLEQRLEAERPRVLHYIGYGHYEQSRDEIALLGDDGPEYIDGNGLAQVLLPHPPALVVLQTCATDQGAVPVDPTSFAMTLIAAGVQGVVAFPYPLTQEVAVKAATRLYQQLDKGLPFRVAVQDTRRHLREAPWSRPALFLLRPSDLALVSRRQW